ncbi:adenylate/guanylate cyclase domain-containing protein [Mesorhizobium sp. NZP2077]|uniref:adenylate/guanylate cyclase domain-containing protein n=1 Tax=Mesorhizobium sp. NZP2077 TaxID=2483404 RepID=UPI001557CE52|nr:adenylate/guanylate cyclase domain-containing protein [Mesorhizobium sp. NZP2077]QKC83480.1 adenylate/guanylate cyclase domain-containing protein [Mesorhizobium sp. NZP2077]QKD16996.1 adenylate/guanylate cyclase domain-containing protein [Mesorhizobium sp. NZP2077]
MSEERVQRRLAAILAIDVVGYSRLTERDEVGTLATLKSRRREILQPMISKHQGRIIKLIGDGALIEFGSAVNAVDCAVELQKAMDIANADVAGDRRIVLRAGINLGDVMVEGGDLYGDGVNVAARLETLSEPGGLCISGSVFEQINGKLPHSFVSLGPQSLKNIDRPIQTYRLAGKDGAAAVVSAVELSLPDKPSIVVLPFVNMSADAEQAYFVDGLTEDLITDLSKVPELFVIARNSSFAYKGRSTDTRQIARELGVKYVLEGSARRVADRVRINAQLIDAPAGGHIWADRFDRDLADIFAAQDEVVGKIVEALAGKLAAANLKERYRPTNLKAHDLYIRGRAEWAHSTEAGVAAIPLFERAIALDPNYADAYRWLAMSQCEAWVFRNHPMIPLRQQSMASARKAIELDPENSGTHWVLAFILLVERQWDESAKEFEISLRLNPNDADAWANFGNLKIYEGRGIEAIACIEKALRLNPRPPFWYFWLLGGAQSAAGKYEEAVKTLRNDATYRTESRVKLASILARLGRLEEAREEAQLYLAANPHFRISHWVESQPYRDLALRDMYLEDLRKAGFPE